MKKKELRNLPREFKDIFLNTKNRIQKFGDVFRSADFSFLTTNILFSADFANEKEESDVEQCRNVFYKIFDDEEFLNEKIKMIEENHVEYIEKLYQQGLIYLWTSLENFIKDFIPALIKFDNKVLSREELSNINIPMAEYFSYDDEDKILYLSELIIKNSKSSRKSGINRFEGYLMPFDLAGSFDSKHKTNIYLLQQIRNCIVHNDSVVDKKFYENCKQLGYEIGEVISIKQEDYRRYEISVLAYLMEIFFRLNKNFGAPERYLAKVKNNLEELFQSSDV